MISNFVTKIYCCWWQILPSKSMVVSDKYSPSKRWNLLVLYCSIFSIWWRPYSYLNFSWNAVISRAITRHCPLTRLIMYSWSCKPTKSLWHKKLIPRDGTRTHLKHILKWSLTKKNFLQNNSHQWETKWTWWSLKTISKPPPDTFSIILKWQFL